MSELPGEALALQKMGFSIIPVGLDKTPLVKWTEFQSRRPTVEEVITWWLKWPNANIGLITGQINDLTVIDCDSQEAIKTVEDLLPQGIQFPSASTPRGGKHFFFRHAPELHSRNSVVAKLDMKSKGGFVIVPPSRGEKRRYAWNDGADLRTLMTRPRMPAALLQYLKDGKNRNGEPMGPAASLRLDKATAGPPGPITEGTRDDKLFHLAIRLFRGRESYESVQQYVVTAGNGCSPPVSEREALAKVESAWKYHVEKNPQSENAIRFVEAKLSDVEEEPIDWLWKGVFPCGMLSIITGNPSVGKTFTAAWISSRLSHGIPFPGQQTGIMGGTLYLTRESPQKTVLKPRLVAAGADCSKITHIQGIYDELGQAQVFDVAKNVPLMKQKLDANPEVRLIIIDPIISFMDTKIDTSNPGHVRHAMDVLAVFADRWKIAIIVIMHLNKNMAQDIIQRNSGSIQFMAAAQVGWVVGPDPNNKFRKLMMPAKNNLAPMTDTWVFDVENYTYQNRAGKTIETGRAVFLEEPQKDVDVAAIISPYAKVDPGRLSKMRQAEILLMNEVIKGGPKDEKELERIALDKKICIDTLRKAKQKMGIDDSHIGQGRGSKSVWFCKPTADKEAK